MPPNKPKCCETGADRPLTLPLDHVAEDQRGLVGGKAANLAVLLRGKLPVPPGFCVTTAAFGQFLDSCPQCPDFFRTLA
jgi:hypothetical protein